MTKAAITVELPSLDPKDVMARKMKAIRQLKSMLDAKRTVKANAFARQHKIDTGILSRLEKADFIRKHNRGVYVWNGGDITRDDNLIAMIELLYPRVIRKGDAPPRQKRPYTRNAAATHRPNFGMTDFEILAYDITSQVDDVVIMKVIARKRPAAVTVLIPEMAASNGASTPSGAGF